MHLIIDRFVKWLNTKTNKKNRIYLIHQGLHIVLIYLIGEVLVDKDLVFQQLISKGILKWVLFIILILRPVNITFKTVFQKYAPKSSNGTEDTIEGAGAMIGNLERLLISIFMSYNQFGAIGLVFTAKSVARFDKISKDPIFAEYYLIGSLYSIISVLVLYGLIKC